MTLSNRKAEVCLALVVLIGMSALPAFSQASGSISGVVQDGTGALIPGAEVTIKNLATNALMKTVSSELGTFTIPTVPIGNHEITVILPGFRPAVVPNVVVNTGLNSSVVVKLEVGGTTEEVTVIAEAQQTINTVSAELSNIIDRRQILDLPLPGRNPIDLARLQAGVAVPSGTNSRTASINGLRGNMTNLTQDGINIQDNVVRGDALFSQASGSVENTGEVSIVTGTVNSDSGTGAAQVKLVTPSGTNEFHGSLFEFHRNRALNANTFFNNQSGTPKPAQIQNRYGGRAGGPVYIPKIYDGRNRTFFFTAYEGFIEPQSTTRNRTVWTPEARQGIFKYQDVNGNVQQVNLLQVAPGGRTSNPITQGLLAATPPPNNYDVGDGLNTGGYRFLSTGRDKNFRFTLRFDHKLTENALGGRHNLEVVINRHKFLNIPDLTNNGDASYPGGQYRLIDYRRFIMAAAVHSTFGPRVYNELRSGMITAPVWFARNAPDPTGLKLPFTVGTSPQDPMGETTYRNSPVYHLIDNFSWVKGTHSLKMGFELRSTSASSWAETNTVQTISFGSNPINSDGLLLTMFPGLSGVSTSNAILTNARNHYQMLTGMLNNSSRRFNVANLDKSPAFIPGVSDYRFVRYREWSLYIADQWRWRSNFTWNMGLRYELVFPPDVVNGGALVPENGLDSLFGISGRDNLFNPGVMRGNEVNNLVLGGPRAGRPFHAIDKNNFAPFIGLAYQPDNRSSIRAGYSISYTREGFSILNGVVGANQGLTQTITTPPLPGVLTSAGVPITVPTFTVPLSDAETYTRTSGSGGFWTYDPNLRLPYVQQWSIGIERELPGRTALEVRYVGNHAQGLLRGLNVNEVNIIENGFLQEFNNARQNLRARGGASFEPGAAGTVPLPIMTSLFTGLAAGSGFANSAFIQQLNSGAAGTMAFTLANSPTYLSNRTRLLPANFFLANPNLNFARYTSNASHSTYNSLQVEGRRRFSRGLFMQANYTFSKALTDGESAGNDPYRTIRNPGLDKHRANFDITHTFNANWLYDLPVGPGHSFAAGIPVISTILEGWQISGLAGWKTAPYKTITSGRGTLNQFTDTTAVPIGNAVQTIRENIGVFRTPQGVFWLNPALLDITVNPATGLATSSTLKPGLFQHPEPGDTGHLSEGMFKSPRFFNTDLSLLKRTKVTETTNVEFRAEFFNIFNNTNFNAQGNVTLDNQQFGRITAAYANRIIQLALRFNW